MLAHRGVGFRHQHQDGGLGGVRDAAARATSFTAASADQDQRAGDERAAGGRPLAPVLRAARRPLGFEQVVEHQPGADDGAHPVADRAVVLDVDGAARRRRSRRRARGRSRSETTCRSAGSGESGNGQRIGWFTEATNRPPGRSTRATSREHRRRRRRRTAGRRTPSRRGRRLPVGQREGAGVGLQQRHGETGRPVQLGGPGQHPGREVERDDVGTRPAQPPRAGRRAAADLQHPPAGDVAEQVRVGLAQPLGAPQEVGVAEVGAVLGEVGRRGGVPPAAVGADRLRGADRPAGDAAGGGVAVAAQRQSGGRWTAAGS